MVMLESPNAARMRARLRRGAQETKETNDLRDLFVIVRPERPAGRWDAGIDDELLMPIVSGRGKLYATGQGGPTGQEAGIVLESDFRFRVAVYSFVPPWKTPATLPDVTNMWLIVNGNRLFVIDNFKPEDVDDYLADVYLSELIGTPIPAVM